MVKHGRANRLKVERSGWWSRSKLSSDLPFELLRAMSTTDWLRTVSPSTLLRIEPSLAIESVGQVE